MTLVRAVRDQLSPECLTNRIRKRRCSLSLEGVPPGNAPSWVAPMELKSGALKTGKVVGQLQSGADAADSLVPGSATIRFVPIVAATSHRAELGRLRLSKVIFRGKKSRIELRPCSSLLSKAFES